MDGTLRLRSIKRLSVRKNINSEVFITVECTGGRAKWIPESKILSLKVHILSRNKNSDMITDFMRSENDYVLEISDETGSLTFHETTLNEMELRSGTFSHEGDSTFDYYLQLRAEHVFRAAP